MFSAFYEAVKITIVFWAYLTFLYDMIWYIRILNDEYVQYFIRTFTWLYLGWKLMQKTGNTNMGIPRPGIKITCSLFLYSNQTPLRGSYVTISHRISR